MKVRVFDKSTGLFLQPEIDGNPFIITQDGTAYQFLLKHPDFHACHYAGKDMRGVDVYEGDIVEVKSSLDRKTVVGRNRIEQDPVSKEFYVRDCAPFPCKVPMTAVRQFYTCVGNFYEKTGPQETIYENY